MLHDIEALLTLEIEDELQSPAFCSSSNKRLCIGLSPSNICTSSSSSSTQSTLPELPMSCEAPASAFVFSSIWMRDSAWIKKDQAVSFSDLGLAFNDFDLADPAHREQLLQHLESSPGITVRSGKDTAKCGVQLSDSDHGGTMLLVVFKQKPGNSFVPSAPRTSAREQKQPVFLDLNDNAVAVVRLGANRLHEGRLHAYIEVRLTDTVFCFVYHDSLGRHLCSPLMKSTASRPYPPRQVSTISS